MNLQVNGIDYKIKIDEKLEYRGLIGECDYNTQTISLAPKIDGDRRDAVLWHEILHAIFEQIGEEQNEALIDRLSYSIHGVLKTNANFSIFITLGENNDVQS